MNVLAAADSGFRRTGADQFRRSAAADEKLEAPGIDASGDLRSPIHPGTQPALLCPTPFAAAGALGARKANGGCGADAGAVGGRPTRTAALCCDPPESFVLVILVKNSHIQMEKDFYYTSQPPLPFVTDNDCDAVDLLVMGLDE